jgi:hypothetical protein
VNTPERALERLERYTNNAHAACDRHAYVEAFDQLHEAHKHLVRLTDSPPANSRRFQQAHDAYFLARCRISARLSNGLNDPKGRSV